jgi:DNA repair exonuclease SbcCD ATPase subunit
MQVEGGFLDGLDLRFEPGLNVLIGGRGTGKSSIIELIRYCLNIHGSSAEDDAKRSRDQALSVLQDGQVTLTLKQDGSDFLVSRAANADAQGLVRELSLPLIFSQMDIESVGLSIRGRLNIIDLFSSRTSVIGSDARKRITQIQSLTTEIRSLLRDVDQISQRIANTDAIKTELARAEAHAAQVSKTSEQLEQKQKQLEFLSARGSMLSVMTDTLRRAFETTNSYKDSLAQIELLGFSIEGWPPSGGEVDLLRPVREKLVSAEGHIGQAVKLLDASIGDIETAISRVDKERAPIEESARGIRREVEGLKEGAGAAARQLAILRERASQLDALLNVQSEKLARIRVVQQQRRVLLEELDTLRDARFAERQRVAQMLTSVLSPQIRVRIREAAQLAEFVGAITNALRGSGLRYNELAATLAKTLSPRELVEAAENYDVKFVSTTAKLSPDRAERAITMLRASNTESIISVTLDDIADFELLDGSEFKHMDALSVGQRCTVVLSILLQNRDRILVVDQPEDHLDNAFIVGTLIGAIRHRAAQSQLVFSSHNANIPVLGEATRVVRLASNGRHGFVMHAEPLDHPRSVDAIVTVMEGGAEAFRARGSFYSRFSNE